MVRCRAQCAGQHQLKRSDGEGSAHPPRDVLRYVSSDAFRTRSRCGSGRRRGSFIAPSREVGQSLLACLTRACGNSESSRSSCPRLDTTAPLSVIELACSTGRTVVVGRFPSCSVHHQRVNTSKNKRPLFRAHMDEWSREVSRSAAARPAGSPPASAIGISGRSFHTSLWNRSAYNTVHWKFRDPTLTTD